ncbi:MAG: hypothetical protein JST84_20505 [Acidobacteria bacterium]|nr:hypothetical protein [Acidobacteriota bacterium]
MHSFKSRRYNEPVIKLSDYPQLSLIAWNRRKESVVSEEEALSLYEANWRWVDENTLTLVEQKLIEELVQKVGNGVLLVSGFSNLARTKL